MDKIVLNFRKLVHAIYKRGSGSELDMASYRQALTAPVSHESLRQWETNETSPSMETLMRMAQYAATLNQFVRSMAIELGMNPAMFDIFNPVVEVAKNNNGSSEAG